MSFVGVVSKRRVDFSWDIPDFFSRVENREVLLLLSPTFSFLDCSWVLALNTRNLETGIDMSISLLLQSGCRTVCCTVWLSKLDGTAEKETTITESFDDDVRYLEFSLDGLNLDYLKKRRSELVPFGTLTIMCSLQDLDVASTSSQTWELDVPRPDEMMSQTWESLPSNPVGHMEYHITLGEQEKVISCNGTTLIEAINNSFGLNCCVEDLKIKKWNTKWSSWEDTTYEDAVTKEMKLKLNVKDMENPNYNETSPLTSAYTALYENMNMAATFEDPQIIDCSTQTNIHRDAGPGNSSLLVGSEKKPQKPWPYVFPVPELPWSIIGKNSLTKKDIKAVVEYMFHAMSSYKMYPTSHEYTEATKALLERYPKLAFTCPGKSPMDFWKVRILDKFRNERKRNFPESSFSSQKRKPVPHKVNTRKVFVQDSEDADS